MYYIGVDLGGSSIKAGLVTEQGNIVMKGQKQTKVKEGSEVVIRDMASLIEELLEESELDGREVGGIGVGIPGAAREDGLVYFATNIFWTNVPLGSQLKGMTNKSVHVANDATMAAVAEYTLGITKGSANSLFITLGTGVGGGVIINHQVYSGSHGIGTELGHMVVGKNPDYDCTCGNNGCWETFASGTAMKNHARRLLEQGHESILPDLAKGDPEGINIRNLFDGFRQKDEVCIQVVNRMTRYLASGIANLINIFDPEVIALGGGISASADCFLEDLKALVAQRIYVKSMNVTRIEISQLGNDAGIIGAAMYAKTMESNSPSP
ncbi:MAG: ROK family protein [Tindallia sp. MSAO_Bac2]|nr:MAG: ROK family protein [Tindallia sp. MSAO_Bac2]